MQPPRQMQPPVLPPPSSLPPRPSTATTTTSGDAAVNDNNDNDNDNDNNNDTTEDGVMKGTWDYIDGKLILAADRPQDVEDLRNIQHDTILVGDVVVRSEISLDDGRGGKGGLLDEDVSISSSSGSGSTPVGTGDATIATSDAVSDSDSTNTPKSKSDEIKNSSNNDRTTDEDGTYDVHISVPEGTVEIGKFMYPKKHPSFFEQPIYKPTPTGSFQLRQVLGGLNARTRKADVPVERFKTTDLQGKRYFLTTYPLQDRSRKKKIEDIKPHERAEVERRRAEEDARPVPIRAVEVELYPNMTFCTVGGLGNSKILRGKWNIIGSEKDQLWMQVFRFGFGRSVSGSTFSEGVGLTHDDQKAYWGRIVDVNEAATDANNSTQARAAHTPTTSTESAGDSDEPKSVEINGSVLDGWGLEPLPVARFTMIEETQEYDDEEEDDMDDDDEEEMFRQSLENYADFGGNGGRNGDGTDDDEDPFSSADAFQLRSLCERCTNE
mmetsp:Transcript_22575/g.48892  ORF Transcript_22575/g.48892 Transcript_22575/m.48892 type:complete len:494 (+) Transcript_22575:541-2022(+)